MTTDKKGSNNNLHNLFNKFIEKVIQDNNNYNMIKSKNYIKSLKVVNIFTDNNEIINISSQKLNIKNDIQSTINSYFCNNNFLNTNYLKKIILFNFNINKYNINQFLSFDYNNFSIFYDLFSINYYLSNDKIIINNNNKLSERFNDVNKNKLYFIDDLDCLYLFFERKNDDTNLFKNYANLKYTKKINNFRIKTKKNKIKK